MQTSASEVVIVGAGIAGIVCALELLEQGRRVLLLDRDQPAKLGGLARESFGGMFAVDTPEQRRAGIRDSVEQALADWHAFAEFDASAVWPQRWARAYVGHCTEHMYWWLRGKGIRYFPVPNWVERGLFTPGNALPRFHMVWGTGEKLATTLIAHLQPHLHARRLELRFGHRVQALLTQGGQVVGCSGVTEADDQPFEVRSEVVVIAAGGINGSMERVRKPGTATGATRPRSCSTARTATPTAHCTTRRPPRARR